MHVTDASEEPRDNRSSGGRDPFRVRDLRISMPEETNRPQAHEVSFVSF